MADVNLNKEKRMLFEPKRGNVFKSYSRIRRQLTFRSRQMASQRQRGVVTISHNLTRTTQRSRCDVR